MVQIIFGIGNAIGTPAYDGLYSKHLDKGKFVSEWGLWETMNYVVLGISAIAGGYFATMYGFNFLFWAMFGFSLIGLFVSLFLIKKK